MATETKTIEFSFPEGSPLEVVATYSTPFGRKVADMRIIDQPTAKGALGHSVDEQTVGNICRAFWRRIYHHRNNHGQEFHGEVPVEFRASMDTALMLLRSKEQPAPIADSEPVAEYRRKENGEWSEWQKLENDSSASFIQRRINDGELYELRAYTTQQPVAKVEPMAALMQIRHATSPDHEDGAYHENAYSIADAAIKKFHECAPVSAALPGGSPITICAECEKHAQPLPAPTQQEETIYVVSPNVNEMVDRFLGWKLPKDFGPDCGISFERTARMYIGCGKTEIQERPYDNGWWPVGTNLFTAAQAKAMFEYVLAAPTQAEWSE